MDYEINENLWSAFKPELVKSETQISNDFDDIYDYHAKLEYE